MNQSEDIKNAVEVLRKGGVILYPTDTVWGIGCDATNPDAVARVYQIKHRDDSKALICLVDSDARLQQYVRNVPNVAWDLIDVAIKPTTIILDGIYRITGYQGAFLQGTVLSVSESLGKYKREYQRSTSCCQLQRYISRNP